MKWYQKNNLDEMQELKLLKIESKGFWLGYWALFLSLAVQAFVYGPGNAGGILTGEFIVLLCMSLYLAGACLRNGIWDRHLQATPAVNIGVSLLAAAVTGVFNAIVSYRNYQSLSGAIATFVVTFFLIAIILSVTMCACTALYHRRRKRLEEEYDDEKSSFGSDGE